jgi:iron complex outermembrane receptor protein
LTDLERVEVLRGPQSTLYGRNSSGGVVNIFSRAATSTQEVSFAASYGKYNSRDFQLALNDVVVKDRLALRIAGVYKAQDGVTDLVDLIIALIEQQNCDLEKKKPGVTK